MTADDSRARARAEQLRVLNERHGEVFRRFCALRDAARDRVFATGAYFDEVTAREDAIREEGGPELAALEAEERALEREIRRLAALPLDAFSR